MINFTPEQIFAFFSDDIVYAILIVIVFRWFWDTISVIWRFYLKRKAGSKGGS